MIELDRHSPVLCDLDPNPNTPGPKQLDFGGRKSARDFVAVSSFEQDRQFRNEELGKGLDCTITLGTSVRVIKRSK